MTSSDDSSQIPVLSLRDGRGISRDYARMRQVIVEIRFLGPYG